TACTTSQPEAEDKTEPQRRQTKRRTILFTSQTSPFAFFLCYSTCLMNATGKPVIMTGDTPSGQLHLGHYVGSVKRRVELQDSHECYFIIANIHAFTTRADRPDEIRRDCLEIVRDYLAMGIDPARSAIFLQSEIPAISE